MNRRQAKKELNKWFACNSLLRMSYNKQLKTFRHVKKYKTQKYKILFYEELEGEKIK